MKTENTLTDTENECTDAKKGGSWGVDKIDKGK